MASKLIIVESPAKAKTLKKFLGKRYKIEASMGHLIDLPKSKLGVDVEENFKPRYITIRGKGKILDKLKKEAKKSTEVYLATDPDREGEAISWHLERVLPIPNNKCRISFNEITKEAVKTAVKEPRDIDENLINAQQARRILDRLVGYKLSPLLWTKIKKGLSAGRVQTVAVRLICEREREIDAFVSQEYWTIEGSFKSKEGIFKGQLYRINGNKFHLEEKSSAEQTAKEIRKQSYVIKRIRERKRKRNPYPPFTTSTMQQEAIKQLKFTARKTMYVAQQLYEGLDIGEMGTTGLITYMRTDSVRTSSEAQNIARKIIKNQFGKEYVPSQPRIFKRRGQSSQDAHEAIRPTDPALKPEEIKKYLNNDQYNLYRLIWERFIASQMAAAEFHGLTVDVTGGSFLFRATGSNIVFPGFLALRGTDSFEETILPPLQEKEKVNLEKLDKEQHFTQPPPRYSEGTLVKTLEENGVGRPSTYAPIVATIQQRGYVLLNNGRFVPTDLGITVNDLLVEYFPEITEVEFTARMEEKLDRIEEGKEDWLQILRDFYGPFAQKLEKAQEKMSKIEIEDEKTGLSCEKCGAEMIVKVGRFGKFLACPRFPECKHTQPYMRLENIDCFVCSQGKIVEKRSKKGRTFYGCDRYPECNFVSWKRPLTENCPECGAFLVEKRKKGQILKECGRPECEYQEKEDESGAKS